MGTVRGIRTGKSKDRAARLRMVYRAELASMRSELMEALFVMGEQIAEVRKQADLLSLIVGDALESLTPEQMQAYVDKVEAIHQGTAACRAIAWGLICMSFGAPEARATILEREAEKAEEAKRIAEAEAAERAIMGEHRQAQANEDADSAERMAALQLGGEEAAPVPAGMVRTAAGLVVPE